MRLRAAFVRTLGEGRALLVRAGLRLDMQTSCHLCRRNSAPPPPKPRGGPSALAGERSEPLKARVRAPHERSLCAQSPVQSEQCCCWTGLAAGSSLDDRHPGELRTPNAAAQTRTVSAPRFWLSQRE